MKSCNGYLGISSPIGVAPSGDVADTSTHFLWLPLQLKSGGVRLGTRRETSEVRPLNLVIEIIMQIQMIFICFPNVRSVFITER